MTTDSPRNDPATDGSTVNASTDEAAVLELLGFAAPTSAPAMTATAAQAAAAPLAAAPALPVVTQSIPVVVPVAASAAESAPVSRRALREAERTAQRAPKNRSSDGSGRASRAPKSRAARPVLSERVARERSKRAHTIGSRLLSLGAMIFAGALAVGMSVPANAFGPSAADAATNSVVTTTTADAAASAQSVAVASSVAGSSTARDDYSVTSWAQMLVAKYGTRDFTYATLNSGPIRWPFPYTVPISSGFGERAAPCRACSSMHMGLDFVPGEGAPIYAMADGVVTTHDDDSGGFGNHVIIDHGNLVGDGNDIASLYAHMQHGSSPLVVGQAIKAGDFIGLVGRTGVATGNHLHFEVHVSGVQVDPFAWLKRYAG